MVFCLMPLFLDHLSAIPATSIRHELTSDLGATLGCITRVDTAEEEASQGSQEGRWLLAITQPLPYRGPYLHDREVA